MITPLRAAAHLLTRDEARRIAASKNSPSLITVIIEQCCYSAFAGRGQFY
jgi:hypothetical protein